MDTTDSENAAPDLAASLTQPSKLSVMRRAILVLAPALATIVLGLLLLTAIYFTLFDWQWIAFLSGILFAALLALASRASRTEWQITRRNVQLNQLRQRLAKETASRTLAENAYHATEERMRLFTDALPTKLIYIDMNQRFRFHNRSYREWVGLRETQINGQLLSDVLDHNFYDEIHDKVIRVLSGEQVHCEGKQVMANGLRYHVQLSLLPHLDNVGKIVGFLGLVTDITERADLPMRSASDIDIVAERDIGGRPLITTDTNAQALFLNSMTEQLTGWNNPEARLRQALDGNEFRLFYQRIIALANPTQSPPYYEILMRLQDEEENLTPPGAFIPLAEHYNMTSQLDYWVLRHIINWHRQYRYGTSFWQSSMYSINLFGSTINDVGFSAFVQKQITVNEIPPQVLCFEIAEEEAIARLAATSRFVSDLRRIGCRIAIGNFGSGRVSFDMLKHLPVHFLKIDGGLVRAMENNRINLAKVKAISRVSKVMGIRTIAQFVENEETLKKLSGFEIDYAQGFGIGQPQPIEKLLV